MKKLLLMMLALCFSVGIVGRAQETTGGIIGVVHDATGASVANATIMITSPALIGEKTVKTDGSGAYRFSNLPAGDYTMIVRSAGFSEFKRDKVRIDVGRFPSIDFNLTVGGENVVVEVESATPQIDVTQSRVQTTVSRDELDYAPRGRSFQSVIQFAPGARQEQLQGGGGYQIDGGATNENGYLIDGINTISISTGLTAANTPIEFVQEVVVKTSGYDAENGGAVGGVVNAVLKKGGNTWHGEGLLYYEGDAMNASPNTSLRYDPQQSLTGRTDAPFQYYQPVKDHYRFLQPGFITGGYLIKDRLWMNVGFQPQFNAYRRTVNFNYSSGTPAQVSILGPRIFTQDSQTYYSTARLDYRLSDKIRLFGSMLYQYYRVSGVSLPNQDDRNGLFNTSSTSNPDNFNHGIGNVQPNALYTVGADVSLTNALVATTRYGYFFQNYGDRGLPTGVRHLFSATGVNIAPLNNAQAQTNQVTDSLNRASGYADIGANTQLLRQTNKSKQFSQDISYYKKGFFGAHNLKGGYLLTSIFNDVNSLYNTALVRAYPNLQYSAVTSTGQTACLAIGAANVAKYGTADSSLFAKSGTFDAAGNAIITRNPNTSPTGSKCQGDYGYLTLYDFSTVGQASTNNHAFYVQDGWTVGRGLTLNLGLRMESEKLPSYNQYSTGINFKFGDKIAPRLGGAWDVLQNGKVKLFGSYGVFYDVVKLHLAIDSFGAAYGHVCAYALDDQNVNAINPVRDASGHFCPASGPGSFAGGTQPANLRFIENNNLRVPSNDPATVATYGQLVDPNLKPYRQHESVVGVDYQLSHTWAFESRYTRRRLDHAIEDVGVLDPVQGEVFHIENPGEGQDYQPIAGCASCPAQPRAARLYDAAEFRFTKLATRSWYGQFSYTYSRLRGNYSGLTDTDIADGNSTSGRTDSNDNRSFDEAYMQFDAHGKPSNGLLATDRPHSVKAITYYRFNHFKRHETTLGQFTTASSGSPVTSYIEAGAVSTPVYFEGRGKFVPTTVDASGNITYGTPYVRRTPALIQTDASFTHSYAISPSHENWRLGFEANFTNLFNIRHATVLNSEVESSASGAYITPPNSTGANYGTAAYYAALSNGYDYKTLTNLTATVKGGALATSTSSPLVASTLYGRANAFQSPRTIRLKVKFQF